MVNARSLSVPGRLKVFLVAGEASGDAYGAAALKSLQAQCAKRGWELDAVGRGGDLMEAEGMRLLKHYRTMSFMGFWEVAKHLPTIFRNLQRAHQDVQREAPDVMLTLDFPGFNMRLAKALARANHPALRVQWVAPQIWAWKPGRAAQLARDFHAVAPILPFEQEALERAGVEVWPCGHPLLDVLNTDKGPHDRDLNLVLLPGSRVQELRALLPVMMNAARQGAQAGMWPLDGVVVAGAPGRSISDYADAQRAGLKVVFGQTHTLLRRAQAAWVASGTATLEAALMDTPHVIAYRTSALTYTLAKRLAQVTHIGLPNLLLQEEAVPELIQHECTAQNLLGHTTSGLQDQRKAFQTLREKLGDRGAAPRLAARLVSVFVTP